MDKTPIAIALERQIPEYIRGEYELFVNFIKAYYEFLNQTQQRNLEDIRSIENTLDEFIIRFKKELSVLFPTNTLANERFILQRIREFYKARGSKESYQFLFRILFNKDSDIFYPSTQILRASDGKWVQEKSLFVKSEAGNLFNLSGKIIDIQTKNKKIHVFCPRVVYYREDIYEVFIDRAYVQDISISDTVLSQDANDYGYILPCPSKYTITSEGAGFEVGQLYYLKAEQGDGSLIKITKIGTGGSIKKIQIISFGLDYSSTYYAKLSNKQATAVPYRHPVPGPYPDSTNGFIDYGYINRQDYFYFDQYYTPSVANDQNVFYADGTYVGEIIASFYTESTKSNVIDADTAEIKIELGSVAVYPGYYSASDGFISDESYIQDGKYYQLFSYVIRVEQQIDSYYNIVKELLHPAGMELFAQYNIKNDYLVSASPLLAFIRRQFLEQEYVTDDEAANEVYKNVVTDDSIAIAFHNLLQDIKDVTQLKQDSTAPTTFTYYDDDKVIPTSDSTSSTADFRFNDVFQSSFDITNIPTDGITNKDVTQLKQDSQIADSESATRYWDISSIVNGTFYQTTSAIHSSSTDIKDVVALKQDTASGDSETGKLFDFSSIVDGTFYQTTSAIHSSSTDIKDISQVKSDAAIPDSETGRAWDISSAINGTFYQTATANHSSSNDIRDIATLYADIPSPVDVLDRTVIYDRSIVPLVSLDPAQPSDSISNAPLVNKSDASTAVGGEWAWDGTQYLIINPEIRIGMGYSRAPDITLIGTVTANSVVVNLTSGTTDGISSGRILTKVSGTGDFGSGTIRLLNTLTSTSFEMNIAASVSGTITFTVVGETPDLAQILSSPTDFYISTTNKNPSDTTSLSETYSQINTYDRSLSDLPIPIDVYNPIISYNRSFTDTSPTPLESFVIDNTKPYSEQVTGVDVYGAAYTPDTKTDAININSNGTLYYNAYNQNDALDPSTSYSYEAGIYSVHDTRAIS